jgi:hypothetical protein
LITYVASKGLDKVWNIAKTNIRKNMLEIDKDFIPKINEKQIMEEMRLGHKGT